MKRGANAKRGRKAQVGNHSRIKHNDKLTQATKQLEKMIHEREEYHSKQAPCVRGKTCQMYSTKPRTKKHITINDIYNFRLKRVVPRKCGRCKPIHPEKIKRIYKRHKRMNEWKKHCSASYCKGCLKKKWASKVHRRSHTKNVYGRKHRAGRFLTKSTCEKSN